MKKDKKVTTINELVGIMLGAFESNQKYMDKNFNVVNNNIKEIHREVQKINLNMVDVVRTEELDKLESRVVKLEKVLDLPKK